MQPLKPGMLAMIVGLKKNTKLNGRCVKLIQPVEPGESFAIPIAPFEVRRYSKNNPSGWVCTGDIPKHLTSIVGGWGIFKPQNLIPLEDDGHQFWDDVGIYSNVPVVTSWTQVYPIRSDQILGH